MGPRELETQRLINQVCPGLTPLVHTSTADGDLFVVEMDRGQAVGDPVTMPLVLEHAKLLARLHGAFRSRTSELEAIGHSRTKVALPVEPETLVESCEFVRCLFGGGIDSEDIDDLRKAAKAGLFEVCCQITAPDTLIHGDTHQMNLIRTADDRLQLIDWGSATIGPGCLDLVYMPPRGVAAYREELCALGDVLSLNSAFDLDLKKANAFRQFDLLCQAVTAVLLGSDRDIRARFAAALPDLVRQLARAVGDVSHAMAKPPHELGATQVV
jgi:hypothetical protein